MPESRSRLTARKIKIADVINGSYYQQEGFDPNYTITPYGLRVSRARILGTVVDQYVNDDESYGAITIDDGSETIRGKFFQDLDMMDGISEGDIVEVIGKVKEYDDEIYVTPELIISRSPEYELLRALELQQMRNDWREYVEKVKRLQDADKSEDDIIQEMQGDGLKEEEVESILKYLELGDDFAKGGNTGGGATITGGNGAPATHPRAENDGGDDDGDSDVTQDMKSDVLEVIESLDDGDGADYGDISGDIDMDEDTLEDVINDLLSDGTCYEPRPGRIKKL